MEEKVESDKKKHWHDRYYKLLLIIPLMLILFSLIYIGLFYNNNGDLFYKDISLTGGTTITLQEKISATGLEEALADIRTRIRQPVENYVNQSWILKNFGKQKKLFEFIP